MKSPYILFCLSPSLSFQRYCWNWQQTELFLNLNICVLMFKWQQLLFFTVIFSKLAFQYMIELNFTTKNQTESLACVWYLFWLNVFDGFMLGEQKFCLWKVLLIQLESKLLTFCFLTFSQFSQICVPLVASSLGSVSCSFAPWSLQALQQLLLLEVTWWALDQGCPWDEDLCVTCAIAARQAIWKCCNGPIAKAVPGFQGHLGMLQWALSHGCPSGLWSKFNSLPTHSFAFAKHEGHCGKAYKNPCFFFKKKIEVLEIYLKNTFMNSFVETNFLSIITKF